MYRCRIFKGYGTLYNIQPERLHGKMKKLFLYTGPIQSGKSSRLLSFVLNKKDIGGILSPVFDKKKYLYDIQTGKKRLLEADSNEPETKIVKAGRYRFRKNIFKWGNDKLKKSYKNTISMLIIDEVGPLEFAGEGLSPIADEIIKNFQFNSYQTIVVVRESLINRFLEHYKINLTSIDYFSLPDC
jgi:nucleoside-triphosphatase THEP1